MSSGQPKDADNTKREQRQRPKRVGLFMLMLSVPPFLNALGNARIQALHVPDVLQLIAWGLCFGFGLGLMLSSCFEASKASPLSCTTPMTATPNNLNSPTNQ
jgi:hypothetical protein